MSWVFHLLWMFLVLMLFFIVLRRIYYFGLQVHRPAPANQSRSQTSQRFAVFTIYQNDLRTAQTQQASERSQPPAYTEPPPPPKYDEVIKTPHLFQKPPPYTATAET
ncbi:uncharacterized protein LOC125762328 [Anopheles funestus]|uniref:uncharacterized protein LOC125762328 n=1 Tax=Anopheles funestus TaxID=62324 RepID=UPI0020C5F09E|nr:uncharacterized protein LOC125762328 [Anopheles funestus]XP_049280238.1 uncharacterized protein LOC125762328 [Anopheles funestus]XP_049280239.1 uncharacterized protein LOC125762328 [Anopheles funestus]XP_049280240.1 uncharacterized protein LOC125762328 [Anopheles funestus]XP_049280241.1 uncharacterized protein LOC125762328 [Anopheles funestus]XP_049280242.1 uncharacterized protein LOC125762328 [Anopheles funestus]XP_049280243.1 uncharacterized protein LOC125762328 [Anopheles funestus]XP_0